MIQQNVIIPKKDPPIHAPLERLLAPLGEHLGGNVLRKGFQNEVEKGSERRIKRAAPTKHGKHEFDTLFVTFQPRRTIQKT